MASLSNDDKRALGKLANQAWKGMPETERQAIIDQASTAYNDPLGVCKSVAFTWWRHRVQVSVTGKSSMLVMDEDDFAKMKIHWLRLLKTQGDQTAILENKARQYRWLIRQECLKRGHNFPEYINKICRDQYRCTIDAATLPQLRRLLITMHKR
ncbi:MAG: hypothetical protein LBV12_06560 [Puniceicoccales bacterium]|jgi:hypothetical protein|nr:hypothetical protein [Puniceicoccales bacterium]